MNLQEELKALKERIAELEGQDKEEREFPKYYDDYWYIDTTGDVYSENWHGFGLEEAMLEIGNIFRTKEEAEFSLEKLKVESELRKFSVPIFKGCYYIYMKTENATLGFGVNGHYKSQGTIYFESEKKGQQAIESVGEDRIKKYIFGVEE